MGSSNKGATTKSKMKLPKEFRQAYTESLDLARDAINTPYEQYQGDLVAGLNDTQLQGIQNINNAYGMAMPYIQRGVDLSEEAAKGITPELYNRFYSPYVRDVANTTFGNMMESNAQQLSGLKGGAIQAGAFGGDRSGIAAAELARQQNLALGQTMSGIYNQGYGQAMGLAGQQVQNLGAMGQQIAGLGVGAQGAALQGAQAQLAAGAQQQATEQAKLQAAYDQYMQAKAFPYQNAQFFANIAQGLGSTAGGTSTTTTPGPNVASQVIGGLGAVGSIASISDARLKENIEPVGRLNDGQTIYRYNFKGDPATHIGLLAQEVEGHRPQSVKEIDGIKGVDYHDATDEAASMESMGGSVGLGRAGFAEGGIPFAPWGQANGWVTEGKLNNAGSSRIPDPPKPYEDKGLDEGWGKMNPLTEDQVGGLGSMTRALGIRLPGMSYSPSQVARGGRIGLASGGIPFDDFFDRTLQFEGGLNPRDTNGTPSNMGINAKANPDVDVLNLDKGGAKKIYKERYWDAIDGDGLSAKDPGLAAAVADTAVMAGPGRAKKLLAASGGDPEKFMALRSQFLSGLVASNPEKYGKYAKAWGNRDAALKGGLGGGPEMPRGGTGVVVQPVSDEPPALGADAPTTPPEDSGKGLGRFFASDTNPSIIESVLGRKMSPEARNAVLTASLGMLAGRSPFFGVNVGEGARAGMETYYNALAQKRENTKLAADIGRQAYEAKTQREGVDVQRLNAARQLYAQMLPQIKFWQMRNPGQPLPMEYRRVIDAAYPGGPQGPARPDMGMPSYTEDGATPGVAAPAGPDAPAAPGAPLPPPPAGGVEAVTPPDGAPAPAPTANVPAPVSGELAALYSQLPDELNPLHWMKMAQGAQTTEDYSLASDRAAKLTEQYQENGIPLPGGVVPFPGSNEAVARKARVTGAATAEGAQIGDYNKSIGETYATFPSRTVVVNGLRDVLKSAETGKFTEFKADLVNAAQTLGLANAEQLAQAEDLQTAMKYFANSILDSGMKDKIGPQISNADLQLVAKGQGTVENLPVANRRILGAMYGKLLYDQARVKAWDDFVTEKGGLENITPTQQREWERAFNAQGGVKDYVEQGIAETPVAGELSVPRPVSYFKPGYKYVTPEGRVFRVKGFKDVNGKKQIDAEWVQ